MHKYPCRQMLSFRNRCVLASKLRMFCLMRSPGSTNEPANLLSSVCCRISGSFPALFFPAHKVRHPSASCYTTKVLPHSSFTIFLIAGLLFLSLGACQSRDTQNRSQYGSNTAAMNPAELEALFEVIEALVDEAHWRMYHPHPCSDDLLPGMLCEEGDDDLLHVTRLQFGAGTGTSCKRNASIPVSIATLTSLKTLLISECFRTVNTTIPTVLGNLAPSLQELSFRSNHALVGSIPVELGKLHNLQVLSISQNRIEGTIPPALGSLTKLDQLDLSYNVLSGPIPEVLGSLTSLSILDLSGNRLKGIIPPALGNLASLQKMDLSSNMLSGKVPPEIGNLRNLLVLALGTNHFTGPFPESLSSLHGLQYFQMDENPMNVPLPLFFGSWSKLTQLSLSHSQIVGTIPGSLGGLMNLSVLVLSNNKLAGGIPASLGGLPQITHLNLSDNLLAGPIPFTPKFMQRLGERLDLHGNPQLCWNGSSLSSSLRAEFRSCKSLPGSNGYGYGYGAGGALPGSNGRHARSQSSPSLWQRSSPRPTVFDLPSFLLLPLFVYCTCFLPTL